MAYKIWLINMAYKTIFKSNTIVVRFTKFSGHML